MDNWKLVEAGIPLNKLIEHYEEEADFNEEKLKNLSEDGLMYEPIKNAALIARKNSRIPNIVQSRILRTITFRKPRKIKTTSRIIKRS